MQALKLEADPGPLRPYRNPRLALTEEPVPVPGPGECLIQVAYCGICGSDFSMAGMDERGRMQYQGLCELPVVPGHEFSGSTEYSELFARGTPVVVEETFGCGRCDPCRELREHDCTKPGKIGFTKAGAFARWVVVPERNCWSIESITTRYGTDAGMQLGALVQPYAIAYSCFHSPGTERLRQHDSLLLLGAGPIGLCAIDLARSMGSRQIHVVEPWEERRAIALKLGATRVYADAAELAPSLKTRWLLDSSGSAMLPGVAARHLAAGGTLVLLSKSGALDPGALAAGHKVLVPDGHACRDSYPRVISLLAEGALLGSPLITSVVDLPGALARLRDQRKDPGKILVRL